MPIVIKCLSRNEMDRVAVVLRTTLTGFRKSNPTACLPGNSSLSGERDCPFGRDQETHRVSPAPAGRFPPVGTGAGLLRVPGLAVCRGPSRTGGGNAGRVSPARRGESTAPASLAGAIAPATAPRWLLSSRGPKAPGQRPPRHRRALACRCSRTCRSAGHRRAGAGETRVAFPVPARSGKSTVTAAMAGAIAPVTALR
jgi:hypothetical protein